MPGNESIIHIHLCDLAIRRTVREEFSKHAERHRLPWTVVLVDDDPHIQEWLARPDLVIVDKGSAVVEESMQGRVLLLGSSPGAEMPSIWFDDKAIGREAARHLIEQGWRQAVVITKAGIVPLRERREVAFSEEFQHLGGTARMIRPKDLGYPENGSEWMHDFLTTATGRTAFFAFQDRHAAWLMTRLATLGQRIPEQVGLISCEDTPVAAACEPSLSSVRTSWRLLARTAAQASQIFLTTGAWPATPPVLPIGVAVRSSTRLSGTGDVLVDRTLALIRRNLPRGIEVEVLAHRLGCSTITLLRHCKTVLGCGPQSIIQRWRLAEVERLLLDEPQESIGDLATRCGWCNASHLARDFRRHRGTTPQQFRALRHPDSLATGYNPSGKKVSGL